MAIARFVGIQDIIDLYSKTTGNKLSVRKAGSWYKEIKEAHENVKLPFERKIPEKWVLDFLDENNF